MKKIIIFGFPHCGTTILRSIVGHIDEVYEDYHEKKEVDTEKKIPPHKKYHLCKFPFTINDFFGKKYKDYIKIFILRNPLWVFSSLNKRFNYHIPLNHSFPVYVKTCQTFTNKKKIPDKNMYLIQYEELFDNSYQKLKDIFDKIGFIYNDDIFDNTKYKNHNADIIKKTPKKKIHDRNHRIYRDWQISQPFKFGNTLEKIDLKKNQIDKIIHHPSILQLYPNIKNEIDFYVKKHYPEPEKNIDVPQPKSKLYIRKIKYFKPFKQQEKLQPENQNKELQQQKRRLQNQQRLQQQKRRLQNQQTLQPQKRRLQQQKRKLQQQKRRLQNQQRLQPQKRRLQNQQRLQQQKRKLQNQKKLQQQNKK